MRAISLTGWFSILAVFVLQIHAIIPLNERSVLQERALISADFWERATSLGGILQRYTDNLLRLTAASSHEVAEGIEQFKGTMGQVVASVGALRVDVLNAAEAHGMSLDDISNELSNLFVVIVEHTKAEFPSPDEAPSHEERKVMVSSVMKEVEECIVRLGTKYGMSEVILRVHLENISPHVERFTIITGDLIEQHPVILETLLFSAAVLLIPESWLLRPLFSLFGYSPYGVVKGTPAAWIQRRFWGAAVARGSWFARLQSAATKTVVPPGTGKAILGGVFGGAGLALSFLGCRR